MEYVALGLSKDRETKEELKNIQILDLSNEEPLKNIGKVFAVEKKPFYNEFELIEQIKEFVKNTPNDQELGAKIRELYEERLF